jgi:hypothetical protein
MLTTVPLSAIEDAWHEIYDTTEEHAQDLMEAFTREQPDLATYVASTEEEISTMDDRGFMMLYAVWIWKAFKLNGRDTTRVTATAIEGAAQRNYEDVMRLQNEQSKQVMDASATFRAEFRQLPILGAIINDIMEGKMEGESRADDITGMMVMCAKTVIDCLDA